MNKGVVATAVLALAIGGAAGWYFTSATEPAAAPASEAERTTFTLPDLDGEQRSLEEWRGQVVVLNFWAPWCPPCRREIPALAEFQAQYEAQGLTVVGIAVDTPFNTQNFVDTSPINYPILVAEEQGIALSRRYGNRVGALPYTIVLDRDGNVVYSHRSEITREQLEEVVQPLL